MNFFNKKHTIIHSYKHTNSFQERLDESTRIKEKYNDRIPCIVEFDNKELSLANNKKKYLVPSNLTCGQLMYIVRKQVKLTHEKALFMQLENGSIPASSNFIEQLYSINQDEDGFLYFRIFLENTFG